MHHKSQIWCSVQRKAIVRSTTLPSSNKS